jgi:hypothetical protein
MVLMQGHKRYGVARRLLAATLSFVLILSSMIGAHAHAAHDARYHDHSAHVMLDNAPDPTANTADDHMSDGARTGAEHTSCADLHCHGGFAILSGQADRQYRETRSVAMIPRDVSSSGCRQSSLDRPPRLSVHV